MNLMFVDGKAGAGGPSCMIPLVLLEDAEASSLWTLGSQSSMSKSQWPCVKWQLLTVKLYRVACQMTRHDGVSGSTAGQDRSHVPPRLIRALCGALGAVAAGQEQLHDVMAQTVQLDGDAYATTSRNEDMQNRWIEGPPDAPVSMSAVLFSLARE